MEGQRHVDLMLLVSTSIHHPGVRFLWPSPTS